MPRRKKSAPEQLRAMNKAEAQEIIVKIKKEIERQKKNGRIKPPGFNKRYSEADCVAHLRLISWSFVEALLLEAIYSDLRDPILLKSSLYLRRKRAPVKYVLEVKSSHEDRTVESFITMLDLLCERLEAAKKTPPVKECESRAFGDVVHQVSALHEQLLGFGIKLYRSGGEDFKENFGVKLIRDILDASGFTNPYSLSTIARHLKKKS